MLKSPTPPRTAWRGRYVDPDTNRETYERLDPQGAGRNEQTRRKWAVAKSRAIAKRREELISGAPRATGTALEAAIERYYLDHPRLRPATLQTYRKGTNKLAKWCGKRGLQSADEITLAELVAFRSALGAEPKWGAVAEGRKGEKRPTGTPRAASAVNVEIRSVKVVLNYLRRAGLLPRCSRDDIADALKVYDVDREAPEFLRPKEIKQLLKAARKHDAETYRATRFEHAGHAPPGGTPRYDAIAPILVGTLLTGMRYGEVIDLDWSEVSLPEGEIHLSARTKTRQARTIDLSVSPALTALLTSLSDDGGNPERGRVFAISEGQAKSSIRRLRSSYGAPEFSWQVLRRTCGTYLTNAPGIFGAASAYRSARQLGHSVTVAEKHYLGVVKVPKDATTLEAAMGIVEELESVVERA